jgi:hypothetical protein
LTQRATSARNLKTVREFWAESSTYVKLIGKYNLR